MDILSGQNTDKNYYALKKIRKRFSGSLKHLFSGVLRRLLIKLLLLEGLEESISVKNNGYSVIVLKLGKNSGKILY